MNVLFLTHYFPPEGNAPASRVHALCKRWVAAGQSVTVVTCAPNVPNGVVYDGYTNAWRHEETIDGIRVVRGWTYLAANRGIALRTLNYLSYLAMAVWRTLFLPRPDVVVATSPQFFCGWAGVWAARLKRVPFVLEIRDIWPDSLFAVRALGTSEPGASTRLLLRAFEWLERRMYRAADRIVAVGDGYKEKLEQRGVPPQKIDVVTNGVDGTRYAPRARDAGLRAEAGAREDDFLVGYVGTVGMAHALEVVVGAGRLARDRGLDRLRFVVVGDGARREELERELSGDDPGNVRVLGWRPKEAIPAWLASLDAALVHLRDAPLFATVLPSKMFEALAMERPILLGVRGAAAELLRSTGGGLAFEPESAEALVDAAARLMARDDRGAALGREGRRRVLATYEHDALAERYARLLEETCGAPTVGPARREAAA